MYSVIIFSRAVNNCPYSNLYWREDFEFMLGAVEVARKSNMVIK